jgi:Calpain large subunit, domain III
LCRMTLEDFCKYFMNLAICHTVNTSILSLSKRWREAIIHSEWVAPGRGGGCINNKATFLNNPQVKRRKYSRVRSRGISDNSRVLFVNLYVRKDKT